ncbi:hypothetical protein EMIT051CA3_60104 [Pseudomonas chlororaphis]
MPGGRGVPGWVRDGRGGWIRTNAWQDQNLLPYRLATPLSLLLPALAARPAGGPLQERAEIYQLFRRL